MSRILGRSYDVLQTINYIQQNNIPICYRNVESTSWEEVENVPNKVSIYLPESAINFIKKDKISLRKNPFRRATFISVPEYPDEKRFIVYPSFKAVKEFEREYAFYLGCLLSGYKKDNQEEILETGREYDDILPLLMDYLYLKSIGKEEDFSLKHLYVIKNYTRNYPETFNNYQNSLCSSVNSDSFDIDDKFSRKVMSLCESDDDKMERLTMDNIVRLSALDGSLQIIDQELSNEELKKLIEDLMLNKSESRSSVLYERGIESYGYKRLKKEIDSLKK